MTESQRQAPPNTDSLFIKHPHARKLFEEAYEEQINGNTNVAISLYKQSLDKCPSAPALTYLGWAHAQIGELEMAIQLCEEAIKLDPDYGNPYNDIGAYLIEMGQEDDAVQWLEQAILAPKYDCKFFPYYNLGKIYEGQNFIKKAISCYQRASRINPDFELATESLERLQNSLN